MKEDTMTLSWRDVRQRADLCLSWYETTVVGAAPEATSTSTSTPTIPITMPHMERTRLHERVQAACQRATQLVQELQALEQQQQKQQQSAVPNNDGPMADAAKADALIQTIFMSSSSNTDSRRPGEEEPPNTLSSSAIRRIQRPASNNQQDPTTAVLPLPNNTNTKKNPSTPTSTTATAAVNTRATSNTATANSKTIDDLQSQQREQMESAVAVLASQLKDHTAHIHSQLRGQTEHLLTDMEETAQSNVAAVTDVAAATQRHVQTAWRRTLANYTLGLVLVAAFVATLAVILLVPHHRGSNAKYKYYNKNTNTNPDLRLCAHFGSCPPTTPGSPEPEVLNTHTNIPVIAEDREALLEEEPRFDNDVGGGNGETESTREENGDVEYAAGGGTEEPNETIPVVKDEKSHHTMEPKQEQREVPYSEEHNLEEPYMEINYSEEPYLEEPYLEEPEEESYTEEAEEEEYGGDDGNEKYEEEQYNEEGEEEERVFPFRYDEARAAIYNGDFNSLHLFLEEEADEQQQQDDAFWQQHYSLTTAVDANGWTLLHESARRGVIDAVRLLLEYGSDPAATIGESETTALDLVMEGGFGEEGHAIVSLLRSALEKNDDNALEEMEDETMQDEECEVGMDGLCMPAVPDPDYS